MNVNSNRFVIKNIFCQYLLLFRDNRNSKVDHPMTAHNFVSSVGVRPRRYDDLNLHLKKKEQ